MPTKRKQMPKKINYNNNLPTIYVDNVIVRERDDGIYYLNFNTNAPDFVAEQARLMTNKESLHNIIIILCSSSNYFPEKPRKSKNENKKSS